MVPKIHAPFYRSKESCALDRTPLVTVNAAGGVKVVTSLSGTINFLKNLGLLYDIFGIYGEETGVEEVFLRKAVECMSNIDSFIQGSVKNVKQRFKICNTRANNGPQGTVSQKTKLSFSLLKKGIDRLAIHECSRS